MLSRVSRHSSARPSGVITNRTIAVSVIAEMVEAPAAGGSVEHDQLLFDRRRWMVAIEPREMAIAANEMMVVTVPSA